MSTSRGHCNIKKLLFVGPYPPPYGGIASHLNDLIPELCEEGYEVVTATPSQRAERKRTGSVVNYYINYRQKLFGNVMRVALWCLMCIGCKKGLDFKTYLKAVNEAMIIADVAKDEKIGAIFIYMIDHGYSIPILKKMIGLRIPIVLMIFGAFYLSPEKHVRRRRYLKDVFDGCTRVLSSSAYCADSIAKVIGYDYPVKVVYVGVNEQSYVPGKSGEEMRRRYEIPGDAVVFLFFGRMTADMGLDFVLGTAEKLLSEREDIYLLIAGAEGEFTGRAVELADREKKVRCCVNIPFSDKADYYHACDVLVAPTMAFHACMGVSIKEAMSCGKPIIASESGGIPEAVEDGINGYIVPIVDGGVDEGVFIERVRSLAVNADLRSRMGTMGRRKVEAVFRNRKTVEDYLQVIEEISDFGGGQEENG